MDIGDALIRECGPPGEDCAHNGSTEKIEAAAKYLAAHAYIFTAYYLRDLRRLSRAFSNPAERSNYPFTVFFVAKDPETLDKVKKAYPGETITVAMVKEVIARPHVKAERAVAKRTAKTKKTQQRGRTGKHCPSFDGLTRGDEIAALPASRCSESLFLARSNGGTVALLPVQHFATISFQRALRRRGRGDGGF